MIKTVLIFLLVDILLAHEGHIQANSLNQTISSLDTSGTDIPAPLVFTNRTNEEKKSVPRKGTPGVIKARKGAILEEPETDVSSSTTSTVAPSNVTTIKFHNKPTAASEGAADEDSDSSHPDYTALIVGLSLGIALVLILAAITYWRMRDVWERRQYKRVDFLIDGLYADT